MIILDMVTSYLGADLSSLRGESEMSVRLRSHRLRTVHPSIPEPSLSNGFPCTLSGEPLAEPPDPHGDHHQAADSKGDDPDDKHGDRP